jgi:hypothetical protein
VDPPQPRRQRHQDADARGVVVGARAEGGGVRVGHDDPQAGPARVERPDHVSRAAVAGHAETLYRDPQPCAAEGAFDDGVGSAFGPAPRRPDPLVGDPDRAPMSRLVARGDQRQSGGRERYGGPQRSSSSRASGSVTGALQAKCSQTYAAGRPSTGRRS